jgi:hypothetical protein
MSDELQILHVSMADDVEPWASEPPPATGSLVILNVGAGDIELRFNHDQPEEVTRAIAMLRDMQRRGYVILVKQADGSYARAIDIDASAAAYVISGSPSDPVATPDTRLDAGVPLPDADPSGLAAGLRHLKRRGRPRRQPIVDSHAVGVGRSAGG